MNPVDDDLIQEIAKRAKGPFVEMVSEEDWEKFWSEIDHEIELVLGRPLESGD